MQIARKPSGLGSLLIDGAPVLTRRLGPVGLAVVCGACCSLVALAILWGAAHAGGLRQGPAVLSFPVVLAACLGARTGWTAWRRAFDARR
ncbi:hypothetical protein [Azospirillum thermophilum]|uniref:Uncharacterized protein n=1 Tax=Azospirillum thermophilum TaxID=2202148 RepID=A0A2S2CYH1_9PROT|nr:hypothetical protein [Azospirillum thermophilum]AWK89465.1 hypothetical protein DEW08_25920 [Azospirillum thermophilum]